VRAGRLSRAAAAAATVDSDNAPRVLRGSPPQTTIGWMNIMFTSSRRRDGNNNNNNNNNNNRRRRRRC